MYRFMGLVWNPADAEKTAMAQTLARRLQSSSSDWHCVLQCDGLEVFHTGSCAGATEAYRLHGNSGVVLGKLFHQADCDAVPPDDIILDASASKLIISSQAKHLADEYWGKYVAFLWDKRRCRHYVLRDPTGGLPCIFTDAMGIAVFMSDFQDFIPLEAGERSVNWSHIAALFWNLRLISRDTGFQEVSQLYAGECMSIEPGSMTGSFRWEPAHVYESGPLLEEPNDAKAALRSAVRNSVMAWASCHRSIIHQLSGGLDSSIVAGCLSGASNDRNIVCLNLATEMDEGDERDFARLAARTAGFELAEGSWRVSDCPLESLLDTGRHVAPFGLHSEAEKLLQRMALERNATAIFSGQGGDHLFQQKRSTYIAAEFVSRHGLRAELASIVVDTSRLTTQSVWHILGTALSYGLFRRKFDPYAEYKKSILLTDEARTSLSPNTLFHPWVISANRLPVSKIEQINLIVDSQHFYLRPYRFADTVHPLISQPIIECCLRIPTYVLSRGGINRALARDAFKGVLPQEIATRTGKGGTTGYLNRLAVDNAQFLRDYLLGGMLVSAHVLKRKELEKQLSERVLVRGELLPDIFVAVRTEAWLRSWARTWQRVAA